MKSKSKSESASFLCSARFRFIVSWSVRRRGVRRASAFANLIEHHLGCCPGADSETKPLVKPCCVRESVPDHGECSFRRYIHSVRREKSEKIPPGSAKVRIQAVYRALARGGNSRKYRLDHRECSSRRYIRQSIIRGETAGSSRKKGRVLLKIRN